MFIGEMAERSKAVDPGVCVVYCNMQIILLSSDAWVRTPLSSANIFLLLVCGVLASHLHNPFAPTAVSLFLLILFNRAAAMW